MLHTPAMRALARLACLAAATVSSCGGSSSSTVTPEKEDPPARKARLQLITNKILSPVALGVPGDGSNRQFICQKEGKVWIIQQGKLVTQPFLDVSAEMVKINPAYDERGLLGIAFHPQFKKRHH